ncbi:MAG: hypothetical protein K0R18_1256 [Bacillales bacterium]|nr:hypothetical protein [Bacillales bacterium]
MINEKMNEENPDRYGAPIQHISDKFDIWTSEDNCPICESKLINLYEGKYCMYEGNHMRYRLHCTNNCYVRIIDNYGDGRPEQDPTWKIFGRDYYIFDDQPRRDRQIKALYDAIAYWKDGERYLIEMMLEGECKWKK